MANIVFVQQQALSREDIVATPRLAWIFQVRNPGLLFSGSVRIDTGFVTDANGHTTTYHQVRPLVFFSPDVSFRTNTIDPGFDGQIPIQSRFRLGSVGLRGPEKRQVLVTYSQAHQFAKGRLTITSTSNLGSLTDFAIWNGTQADPNDFYVESATDLNSGNVTASSVRMNAIFVPHPNARYLAVGAKVYSMPNTGTWRTHYFKKWMVEKLPVTASAPSTKYGQAREVVVKVKPDRLNYFTNPSAEVDATGVTGTGAGGTPTITASAVRAAPGYGVQSFLLTSTVAGTNLSMLWNAGVTLQPGDWVVSWWAYSANVPRTAGPTFGWNVGGAHTVPKINTRIEANKWTRVWGWFTLPVATNTVSILFDHQADTSQGIGATLNIDNVLFEKGRVLRDYFDGSFSADTVWEAGGTTGKTRSYLYKNRAERYAAIKRVLKDNVPLGIGTADPQFGTLPAS